MSWREPEWSIGVPGRMTPEEREIERLKAERDRYEQQRDEALALIDHMKCYELLAGQPCLNYWEGNPANLCNVCDAKQKAALLKGEDL